jgi:dTDP-L-rhamnose 4-epimerase
MIKNVLISGGAGFIGSNLALALINKEYRVTILDNLSEQIHGDSPEKTSSLYKNIEGKVHFFRGSVTNRNDWLSVLQNQDAVIHLAAETGTGQSMYEIEKYTHVNVGGTALLLDILTNIHHQIKKVIVASSRAIYGEGKYNCLSCGIVFPLSRDDKDMSQHDFECKCPKCGGTVQLVATTEDSLIHPNSVYGITKQTQENLVMTVCPAITIHPVALRYQNVYGVGQSLSNPYTGILSVFSTRIKNRHDINIFEDGKESRDFIYIDDTVTATILALEKDEANGHIFNVGTGKTIDVQTVASMLIEKYHSNIKSHISGNYRNGDIRHNFADISKINKLLGFVPQFNFEQGIHKFVEWVDKQPVKEDKYEVSIKEMKEKGFYK